MASATAYTVVPQTSRDDTVPMTPSSSRSSPDLGDGAFEKGDVELKELGQDDEKTGLHDVDLSPAIAYSGVEERSVLKKLDRRVVLFVALLYMLSFLDRSSM
jgi:hypothetical protein